MQDIVKTFIARFLSPTPGTSPKDIKAKILHWVEVANNPEKHTDTQDARTIATKRRNAMQNLRRLAANHPDTIAALSAERTDTPEAA